MVVPIDLQFLSIHGTKKMLLLQFGGLTWLGRAQRSQIGGPRDPQRCARNTAFVSPGILLGELKLYYVVLAHPKMGLIWSHRR